jgi:hypothetical protein
MMTRAPRTARVLGLWTATWLGALLLAGLLWVGDLSVQWPVLAVPVIWALLALRPRRPIGPSPASPPPPPPPPPRSGPPRPVRSDTVEWQAVRRPDWEERRR